MNRAILGEAILDLCRSARDELVLCAPFVKGHVIQRVMEATPSAVAIRVITRWRPEEVAAGVSDVEVLALLGNRGDVVLHDRLHAKYFRTEDRVLLGSANLTGTALGWASVANLELLVEGDRAHVRDLEGVLMEQGVAASEGIAHSVASQAALLTPRGKHGAEDQGAVDDFIWAAWFPSLRDPTDLYRAYEGQSDRLSSSSAVAARRDLTFLDLPLGLDRERFSSVVGSRLQQHPIIAGLDEVLVGGSRFGAVRDVIASRYGLETADATTAWQTLMRWLLEFLPADYATETPRHSEIFYRLRKGGLK